MNIELTEQQARSVAAAARNGLIAQQAGVRTSGTKRLNAGDTAAAFRAADILDAAWRRATNTEEPATMGDSSDG